MERSDWRPPRSHTRALQRRSVRRPTLQPTVLTIFSGGSPERPPHGEVLKGKPLDLSTLYPTVARLEGLQQRRLEGGEAVCEQRKR